MIKNKVKSKNIKQLRSYYRKNQFLMLLMIFLLLGVAVSFIVADNTSGVYFIIFAMIALIIIYGVYIFQFQQGVSLILTEELDLKRAIEANSILKPDTLAMPTLYYAYAHLVAGDWEKTEQYLSRLKIKRLRKSNVKAYLVSYLITTYFLDILQGKNVSLEDLSRQFGDIKVKKEKDKQFLANRLAFLQAMADIESGKVNAYFETAEARHRLDRLIFDYYLGRNALLEGKEAEARELFEKVAQTNKDDIYFVREAKKYFEEMRNDAGKTGL